MTVTWSPGLPDVAKYVPRRTIVGATDGYGTGSGGTFSPYTHPTDAEVMLIIADAVAWVQTRTGVIDATLAADATSCASLRSAGLVELTYPDSPDDLNTANTLLAMATASRDELAKANDAITGTDPDDPASKLPPVWSFPPPVPYGDYVL